MAPTRSSHRWGRRHGQVYRARAVALKVLLPAFARDAERMARFTREAQLLAALNHPNIASLYGLDDSGGVRALQWSTRAKEFLRSPLGPDVSAG